MRSAGLGLFGIGSLSPVFLLLCLGHCGTVPVPPPDPSNWDLSWDLAFSVGNNVSLLSVPTGYSYAFPVPLPSPDTYSASKAAWSPNSGHSNTSWAPFEALSAQWTRLEITALLSVPEQNFLFFSHYNSNLTNLGLLDLTTNVTTVLFQAGPGGVIDYLAYYKHTLYFADEGSRVIRSLRMREPDFPPSAFGTVAEFREGAVGGLAVDPSNGNLYWSTHNNKERSRISFRDGAVERTLLDLPAGLHHAHGLTISGPYLYFINTPRAGSRFLIERVATADPTDREVLVHSQHQLPFSLAVLCGRLYWTDYVTKSLFGLDLRAQGLGRRDPGRIDEAPSGAARLYQSKLRDWRKEVPAPYAVEARAPLDLQSCIERNLTPAPEKIETKPDAPAAVDPPKDVPAPAPRLKFCSRSPCSNGATCVALDSIAHCLCSEGYTGSTCELKWDQIPQFTANNAQADLDPAKSYVILSLTLAFVLLATALIAIFLGVKVYALSGKPRIKRRVIVAKVPSSSTEPASVSEMIDIENCCNMNVCETPCYSVGSSGVNLNGRLFKTKSPSESDKERLLDC